MSTILLTYDDIPVGGGPGLISAPGPTEDGFHFSTNMVAALVGNGSPWPSVNPLSGNQVMLEAFAGPTTITYSGGDFSLIDTYITGWNTQSVTGTITGLLNGVQVGQVSWSALGPDPGGGHPTSIWNDVFANFGTVDTIIISSNAPFVLDNTTMDPPSVPEPAPIALLLAGALLLTMWFSRRVAS
jgi:hypothetical protein